jgi:hypothetical protein
MQATHYTRLQVGTSQFIGLVNRMRPGRFAPRGA